MKRSGEQPPKVQNESTEPLAISAYTAVLQFLPLIEAPSFSPGEWPDTDRPEILPFCYSSDVEALLGVLYAHGWVYPFDWNAWAEGAGKMYLENPAAVEKADELTLRKMLTTHVRADRFCDGHLADALNEGKILAILRRMRELLERRTARTVQPKHET